MIVSKSTSGTLHNSKEKIMKCLYSAKIKKLSLKVFFINGNIVHFRNQDKIKISQEIKKKKTQKS